MFRHDPLKPAPEADPSGDPRMETILSRFRAILAERYGARLERVVL